MFDQYEELGSGGNEKKVWKVLLLIVLISSLSIGVYAYSAENPFGFTIRWLIPEPTVNIITLPVSDIGTNYVTLNGNISRLEATKATVWFEYGRNKDSYIYRTKNQIRYSSGNFSQEVEGIQLMPDTTYYFRACGEITE